MTPTKTLPALPESAPFSEVQRQWINGFLGGLFSGGETAGIGTSAPPPPARGRLLLLWGSQTGGAEKLAKQLAKKAVALGFAAEACGLDSVTPEQLAEEKRVAILTSTYGDGEMPDNAQAFWDRLCASDAPGLPGLEYSVLSLGDSNYVQFCEAGKRFDARLRELGGICVVPRVDCDVDYKKPASAWMDNLLKAFGAEESAPEEAVVAGAASEAGTIGYDRDRPFAAPLIGNRLLNREGSSKEVRHIEIGLNGSGLDYEVGDALGVMPMNCPEFVDEILQASGLRGSEPVESHDGLPLRLVLQTRLDLGPWLTTRPEPGLSADALVKDLRPLQPRLYSICSSPKAHPGEVHLTVGIVRYEVEGRRRKGVCSTFLADRTGGIVPVFVHRSPAFRLPSDPSLPIIMVGPGTGIAPFRAFLEERKATGATGRNWLFFGDQHAACDFLYRDELEAHFKEGLLTRLDTAFSRDQAEKIYVQDRMRERAAELWKWLEAGACFYVCGDAKRMAKDVDQALHEIARVEGGLSHEAAAEYIKNLKTEKRYLRDVY